MFQLNQPYIPEIRIVQPQKMEIILPASSLLHPGIGGEDCSI